MAELVKIVDIQLRRLRRPARRGRPGRPGHRRRQEAQLADEGFDPTYGARPLKRIIQQRLANPLATSLLDGRRPGSSRPGSSARLTIDWDGDEFTFGAADRALTPESVR